MAKQSDYDRIRGAAELRDAHYKRKHAGKITTPLGQVVNKPEDDRTRTDNSPPHPNPNGMTWQERGTKRRAAKARSKLGFTEDVEDLIDVKEMINQILYGEDPEVVLEGVDPVRKHNYAMLAHLDGNNVKHLAKFVDALSAHGYKLRKPTVSPFTDGYHAEARRGRHIVGLTNTEDKVHGSDWAYVSPKHEQGQAPNTYVQPGVGAKNLHNHLAGVHTKKGKKK